VTDAQALAAHKMTRFRLFKAIFRLNKTMMKAKAIETIKYQTYFGNTTSDYDKQINLALANREQNTQAFDELFKSIEQDKMLSLGEFEGWK